MGQTFSPKALSRTWADSCAKGHPLCQQDRVAPVQSPHGNPTARSSDTLANSGGVFKCFIKHVANTVNMKELALGGSLETWSPTSEAPLCNRAQMLSEDLPNSNIL